MFKVCCFTFLQTCTINFQLTISNGRDFDFFQSLSFENEQRDSLMIDDGDDLWQISEPDYCS